MKPESTFRSAFLRELKKTGRNYAVSIESRQTQTGFSDSVIMIPDRRPWFVEFKIHPNKLSPKQARFLQLADNAYCRGYCLIKKITGGKPIYTVITGKGEVLINGAQITIAELVLKLLERKD